MDRISNPENKVALECLSPSFTAAFKEYRRQRLPCILTAFLLIKMNLHLDSKLKVSIIQISDPKEPPEKCECEQDKKIRRQKNLKL